MAELVEYGPVLYPPVAAALGPPTRYPLAAAAVPPDGIEPIAIEFIPLVAEGCIPVGAVEVGDVVAELAMVLGVYLLAGLVG